MDLKKIYEFLYKNFVGVDALNPEIESIKHLDGRIYASDGHILAKVECEYPADREGKAFRKDGGLMNNSIRYESVIPASYTDDTHFTNRIDDLRAAVKKVYRLGKGKDKAVIDFGIFGEDASGDPMLISFQASQLLIAFQLFDLLKEEFTIRVSSSSARGMMLESLYSDTKVLIMPVWTPVDEKLRIRPTFTIEEALNYKPEISTPNKAWYEL